MRDRLTLKGKNQMKTLGLSVAAFLAATSPMFARMVACDSAGHYTDQDGFVRGVAFDWAVRKSHTDARDPVWQHAYCDPKRHVVLWCLPGPDEEITPACKAAQSR
jgi:hypothetical protein